MARTLYERVIVCGSPEIGPVRLVSPTMSHMLETGVFWYGDNLEVMREHLTGDGEVDLIYLDPPFNSKHIYGAFFTEADASISRAQLTHFEDYWRWGKEAVRAYDEIQAPRRKYLVPSTLAETMQMLRRVLGDSNMMAYLSMMAVRLVEMKRLLKDTGSIYLHCDPTASHYIKLVLDALFEPKNFRNEIIWQRTKRHNSANSFGPVHDVILYYARSSATPFMPVFERYTDKYLTKFRKVDEKTGENFRDVVLTGTGVRDGDSGKPWGGHDPTKDGRHWQPASYVYWKYTQVTGDDASKYPLLERLDRFDKAGIIFWPKKKGGQPAYKFFLEDALAKQEEQDGAVRVQDTWTDINALNSQSLERQEAGYPTQKPVALLERILTASSKQDQVVLDPFCGCGTAVVAAQKMGRKWIGIDITHLAVSVLKRRLEKHFPDLKYRVRGEPEDAASARRLAKDKPLEFQAWMVDKVGGIPVAAEKEKKVAKAGGDDNRDGYILFRDDPKAERSKRMLLSVKAGESYQAKPEIVDALGGAMKRHGAPLGALLMSHEPSGGTYKRAASYGTWASETYASTTRFPVIQIVVVDDIFMDGWHLQIPGENTSRKSQPPPGTPGASEELFDATGQPKKKGPSTKKTSAPPGSVPGQIEIPRVPSEFRLTTKKGGGK